MQEQLFGIITICFCGLVFWLAYKKTQSHQFFVSIVLLIIGGLILRLFVSADFFLHPWDERFHALVAKNLINHPLSPTLYDNPILPFDYKNWSENHIWVHKQPLPLWSISFSLWTFGINEIALRLPSILLTTIGILLTFQIGKNLYNKKVGFIAAFLYSIHGLIIEVTGGRAATDHIDVFFLFFIELAVLFAINFAQNRKILYNILCGISIGLAILSKWLPALIVLPIWLLLVIYFKKHSIKQVVLHFTILCLTILIISLPWQIYIHYTFPDESNWESSFNIKHITEALEGHGGSFFYHFNKMRMIFGEIIYIPIIWFCYKTIKRRNDLKKWSLAIWILIPYMFFSLAKTKMQCYTLFTAPAIFIITALFWHYLYTYRNQFKYKWLSYIVLFLLIVLPLRYSFERIKPLLRYNTRNPQWTEDIKQLNKIDNSTKKIIFNTESPIEIMFYTDFIAYKNIPDSETLNDLLLKGYKIYICDNKNLKQEFKKDKNIKLIKLSNSHFE